MALLNPYLSFTGNARDALEFYRSVFGGELTISTYGEFQMAEAGSADADRVMHGQLTTPSGFTLMASDIPPGMPLDQGSSITISLSGSEGDELRGYWDGLADGGNVGMPLEKAPWGDYFGQLTDRFGTDWMVNIAGSGDVG
jgi:PhnB protein